MKFDQAILVFLNLCGNTKLRFSKIQNYQAYSSFGAFAEKDFANSPARDSSFVSSQP